MKNNRVVILFNKISENPLQDELDVLAQVNLVSKALSKLGYITTHIPFSFEINKAIDQIKKIDPYFVFNLVESIDNKGELCHLAPAVLRSMEIPYSGVPVEGMFLTTNKILTKSILRSNNLPTADWFMLNESGQLKKKSRYILKPTLEDGSLGLDIENVFYGSDKKLIDSFKNLDNDKFFIEEFIDGREFNISVIGGNQGPEVLSPAEMLFIDFPENLPKILGYKAKWNEESEEYKKTVRTFDFKEKNKTLIDTLTSISQQCWKIFGLKGYARIDFRLDQNENPFILEINANPCIAPDSGLVAAIHHKGYPFEEVIARIVEDIFI